MKPWVALIAVAAMLCAMGAAEAAEVTTAAVAYAAKQLGLRERSNRNDHPEIDRMLAYCGLDNKAQIKRTGTGYSWCMAFVLDAYRYGSASCGQKNPLYRSARCYSVWRNAMDNPLRHYIIKPEDVLLGRTIPAGAVAIWRSGSPAKSRDWNGHTGLTVKQLSTKSFLCREGNTMPSNRGNQREGGGVYDRVRGFGLGTTFEVQGWICPKERITP